MERVTLEPIFILHRKKFKDNSYIVDIFSKKYGKIKAISRSISKHKKHLMQPFVSCYGSWVQKNDLATLNTIEPNGNSYDFKPKALMSAFYLNELLIKATITNDPHPKLFSSYARALASLAEATNLEASLRIFEKQLLEEVGYGINLDILRESDASWYSFSLKDGLVPAYSDADSLFSASMLRNLAANNLVDLSELKQCKNMMKTALEAILKGRELKSKMLWHKAKLPEQPQIDTTKSS
jgi:DNA repair protein RecO (recombination protein O)